MRFCYRSVVGGAWLVGLLSAASLMGSAPVSADAPTSQRALGPSQLGIVVNEADPQSVSIAEYYQHRRAIPKGNIIRLRFRADSTALSVEEFTALKSELDRKTPSPIQAYALTWLKPYRVACMSMTSAIAFGFDPAYCSDGCQLTRRNLYFNS